MTSSAKAGLLASSILIQVSTAGVAVAQVSETTAPSSPERQSQTATPQAGDAPAISSDQAQAAEDDIVVTGIRASLGRALETKKNAVGFVDAINAEDVGKLPDQNVAEALQRVTGVSIQRSRGEGDFVSIRGLGPNFVRGTINGRTLVSSTESRDATRMGGFESSTGRETNFDILPAEIISSIDVVKSPSASDVEGGIGGIVNVKTQRPLTLGTSVAASAKGTYREFNDKFDPSAAALASWRNESGTFGVLGAISYSKRSIREDDPDSYGYATFGPTVDTDANGTGDRSGLSFPFSLNPQSFAETRERVTAQGTLQWQLPDDSNLVVDVLYSHRNLQSLALIAELGTCCGFLSNVNGNGVTNPDGSIQIPGIKIVGNSAVGYPLSTIVQTDTDRQEVKDDLVSVGGNYTKSFGDWKLDTDLSYSTSTGRLGFRRVSLTALGTVPFVLSTDNDQIQLTRQPGGIDLTNLANYRTNNVDVISRRNRNKEFAGALNATRELPGSFISAIEFGAHYRVRTIDRTDATSFSVNSDKINAAGLGTAGTLRFNGDFADGASSFPFGSLIWGNTDQQLAFLRANNPNANFTPQYSAPQSFRIKEQAIGAYVQADIDGTLGGVPIKGNIGVRVVQTLGRTTGFFQPFRIDNDANNNNLGTIVILDPTIAQTTFDNNYLNILPSLNLSGELADGLFLRFAAGRSVTRPTFTELAPGLTGINVTQRTANSGNPQLKAYESTNVDLGLEYYFARSSALYGSVFAKDIDQFIGTSTVFNTTAFGVPFNSISQPANQGKARIAGAELGYQQTFDFGIGYILNATFISSSAEFTQGSNAGTSIPFEGVSKRSYNGTLFYEKHGFNARASYSYRSDYVLLSSDGFGNTLITAPYGQLDGSLSYTYNDRYTIFANAINLTKEVTRIYSDTPLQPNAYSVVGRRFEIGLRAKF